MNLEKLRKIRATHRAAFTQQMDAFKSTLYRDFRDMGAIHGTMKALEQKFATIKGLDSQILAKMANTDMDEEDLSNEVSVTDRICQEFYRVKSLFRSKLNNRRRVTNVDQRHPVVKPKDPARISGNPLPVRERRNLPQIKFDDNNFDGRRSSSDSSQSFTDLFRGNSNRIQTEFAIHESLRLTRKREFRVDDLRLDGPDEVVFDRAPRQFGSNASARGRNRTSNGFNRGSTCAASGSHSWSLEGQMSGMSISEILGAETEHRPTLFKWQDKASNSLFESAESSLEPWGAKLRSKRSDYKLTAMLSPAVSYHQPNERLIAGIKLPLESTVAKPSSRYSRFSSWLNKKLH